MEEFISGGISGAITDPNSDRAIEHAFRYYEEIRKNHSDVEKIAKNTEFSMEQILAIKHYLFIDEHLLDGETKRFDPSFEIAESWQRLAFMPKEIKPHDITLLNHELMEMKLINKGMSQNKAHEITCIEYNYPYESDLYYSKMNSNYKNKEINQNSGGINKKIKWEERC